MVDAMVASLGIVSTACKAAGINRCTHYDWLKADPKYAQTIKDIEEGALDFAESALLNRIRKEDTTAIIFYLKTKGKKRGFVEQHNLGFGDGQDGEIIVRIGKPKINGEGNPGS